ncbi:hypothetical protein PR371_15750 [Mycobacterium marinum]|uniref:hypothetical protein n=1 Tax=Mycobacterium marinum TaxID=1781 RepID=UPI00233FDAAE|nr:hypothetical protein [Mycobacterium marinum]MDC8995432.1 hypothetical protein [Mycobacterium marinum]WDZ12459.1 hypothetical protein PQR73_017395 [Mycobacterium marinum]
MSGRLRPAGTDVVRQGLCRCAIEASAKTIWLLAPEDREERRARCLGYNQSERQPQQAFIRVEERVLQKKQENGQPADFDNFNRHRTEYDERQAVIAALPRDKRKKPPGDYLDIVDWSAKWIDANRPAHAAQEMGYGMELAAERFYSYGSSFVHGYKWMTDYIRNDEQSLTIVADGFAAAVIMTESAICLFEAQCTTTAGAAARRKNYPEWLVPTIDAWIPRYQ